MATNNALNNAMIAFLNDDTFATATTTSGASSTSIKNYVDAKFETGTFTPTITFDTPGDLAVTYTSRAGSYTRIVTPTRKICFITFDLSVNTMTFTTASGNVRMGGLPFAGIGTYLAGLSIQFTSNFSWGTNGTFLSGTVGNGASYFNLQNKINNGNFATLAVAQFTSGFQPQIRCFGWYYTS